MWLKLDYILAIFGFLVDISLEVTSNHFFYWVLQVLARQNGWFQILKMSNGDPGNLGL